MKSVYFSPEHDAFRGRVREYLSREVLPFAEEWERDRCIPRHAWQAMGQGGLLGLHYPRTYGGAELDLFHSIVFLEELGRTGYAGLRAAVSVHEYMATHYIATSGSEALKRAYLTKAIAGEKVAALAITERDAGSDLNRIATTATLDGDCFVVNGEKTFVTNGTTAGFLTLAARTAPASAAAKHGAVGLSLLVVDADSPGISRARQEKIGWHCSDTAELRFEGVRVPAANLIGRPGSGFISLMRGFQLERLVAATLAVGGMVRCMEETCRHLLGRRAFQGTLAGLHTVRHRLADLSTDIEAARQLVYHAAWLYQRGELPIAECSMAKLRATEVASRVAAECMHLHGSAGYLDGSAISRIYRDAPAATLAGGASEVMRDIIAQLAIEGIHRQGGAP
ncbi:acyl-CoA dehydrogenase family protein [Sorangium sp. So ce1036]|uniref:acyl-CoA dehydrogenase family protein n=1 Tax=Sorangium sp. So ce1036 TaxID=3133328 RepID=UPI003F038C49